MLNGYWKRLLNYYMWTDIVSLHITSITVRVFANGPGDWGSILSLLVSKTQNMVLDTSLLDTQHYKVRDKGKVEQSREKSSALLYTMM